MLRALALVFAILLVSGCLAPHTAVPLFPPEVKIGSLEFPADRIRAMNGIKKQVEEAFAAGNIERIVSFFPDDADSVREWAQAVIPGASTPTVFTVKPLFPFGQGIKCDLDLEVARMKTGGYSRYHWGRGVFIAPDQDGSWKVRNPASMDLGAATLVKEVAGIWLSPEAEWISAEVTATVKTAGMAVLPFRFAGRTQAQPGLFRVVEVSQDGKPCPFLMVGTTLAVQPARPAEEVVLHFRYEGEPVQNDSDYISAKDIVLRHDAAWLPTLPSTYADFDVVVRYPRNFTLFGQGEQSGPTVVDQGWMESRWRFPHGSGFTLYGGPSYQTTSVRGGGAAVSVAVWPEHARRLDPVAIAAKQTLDSLALLLGPYPKQTLRVVESGYMDGRAGYGAVTNITLGWRNLVDEIDLEFFAHEFAHGWFPGVVPTAYSALYRGQWSETLAEYLSSLVVGDKAEKVRAGWSRGYASLPLKMDRPMLEVGTASAPWQIHYPVTYQKGALVLTALEDRIGRDKLVEALKTFLQRRAGKMSTWDDLVAVIGEVCGSDAAAWLKHWLSTPSAPDLRFDQVAISGGQVSGKLGISPDPAFDGTVEIGCFQGEKLLSLQKVPFTKEGASFQFDLPSGSDHLVLDPRYRLPRRYDPKADPMKAGLMAPVAGVK